ncbi:MAG: hypothetical protein ABSE22_06080 [Xanthobacteraceae bacterium]
MGNVAFSVNLLLEVAAISRALIVRSQTTTVHGLTVVMRKVVNFEPAALLNPWDAQ